LIRPHVWNYRNPTHSDSETILRAYAAWGLDFLPRLNGMFAFALYDRGRLGIKPLYVLRRPDRLLFGSELKVPLPACPAPELVPEALAQYLAYDYSSGPDTLVRGIQRRLPGQALIVERDLSARTLEYWSPLKVKPRQDAYEDFAAEFDELMDQVMREHLRADVPFGLFLSGGVDSSLLLAQIARRQDRPVRSFSVGFAGTGDAGELPAAEAAARRYSAEHTPLLLEPDALLRRLPPYGLGRRLWMRTRRSGGIKVSAAPCRTARHGQPRIGPDSPKTQGNGGNHGKDTRIDAPGRAACGAAAFPSRKPGLRQAT
jgi:asparagine synthase (glutamine-hydrolysing)